MPNLNKEFEYNPLRRWSARYFDSIIVVCTMFGVVVMFTLGLLKMNPELQKLEFDSLPFNIQFLYYVLVLIPLLYYPLMPVFFGQTLGQKINSLKILTLDNEQPSFWRLLLRTISNLIPMSEVISGITILTRDDKKSLYDLISKTKTVEYKTQKHLTLKSILSIVIPILVLLVLFVVFIILAVNSSMVK